MFPDASPFTLQLLAEHNRHCGGLLDNWYRHAGAAWTPGMITSPDLAARMETFCPWSEVSRSLRSLARSCLPGEEWTPLILRPDACASLIDFWAELPQYTGTVTLEPEELPAFFCACADPPRMGTTAGRYPAQLALLPPSRRLLDLGCGVGCGTLEIARAVGAEYALGVTIEPLEAWMANERRLPHDPERERQLRGLDSCCRCEFRAGDVLQPITGEFDLIVCNGLAGGRFLNRPEQLLRLLENVSACLATGGVFAAANSFHPGHQTGVETLMRLAEKRGWHLRGDWRSFQLRKGVKPRNDIQ